MLDDAALQRENSDCRGVGHVGTTRLCVQCVCVYDYVSNPQASASSLSANPALVTFHLTGLLPLSLSLLLSLALQ